MADAKAYYARIAEERAKLLPSFKDGGFPLLVSVQNIDKNVTGGVCTEVTVDLAAKALVDGTHRLATADEAKAYKDLQESQRMKSMAKTAEAAQQAFITAMNAVLPPQAKPAK